MGQVEYLCDHAIRIRMKKNEKKASKRPLNSQSFTDLTPSGVEGQGQVASPVSANSRRYVISLARLPGNGFRGSRKVSSQAGLR